MNYDTTTCISMTIFRFFFSWSVSVSTFSIFLSLVSLYWKSTGGSEQEEESEEVSDWCQCTGCNVNDRKSHIKFYLIQICCEAVIS